MTKDSDKLKSPLLTLPEAARFTKLSTSNLRARVARGQLPVVRFGPPGSKLFFLLTDLQTLIATHRINGGGA